jgi:hypothetical protein
MPIQRRTLLGALASLAATSSEVAAQAQRTQVVHVGPFSGGHATEAKELNEGLAAGLKQASIGGNRPSLPPLLSIDDRGDPAEFLRVINRAEVRNALCLVAPQGAAMVDTLLRSAWLDRNDVLVLNPIPGADAFRQPGHQRLLHIRASDGMQIGKVITHAHTIGQTTMTVVTQHDNSPAGDHAWEAAKTTNRSTPGLKLLRLHLPNHTAGMAQLREGLAPETQSVLAVGAPDFMTNVLGVVRKVRPEVGRYALSYLTPRAAAAALGDDARGIAVAQVFPSPRAIAKPLMARFHASMQTHQSTVGQPTVNHLEGFIIAQVIAEGLRRVHTINPTDFLASLRSRAIELNGFSVDFTAGNSGSRYVELGIIGSAGELIN